MNYNSVAQRLQPRCNFNGYNTFTVITIGSWLKQHRKNKGLTQRQVADRAGVSFSYVSTLEREQAHSITAKLISPRRESVVALAKAVGGDVDDALGLAGFAKTSEPKESAEVLFKFGAGLIGYDDLTDAQKKIVQQTTQNLIHALRASNHGTLESIDHHEIPKEIPAADDHLTLRASGGGVRDVTYHRNDIEVKGVMISFIRLWENIYDRKMRAEFGF